MHEESLLHQAMLEELGRRVGDLCSIACAERRRFGGAGLRWLTEQRRDQEDISTPACSLITLRRDTNDTKATITHTEKCLAYLANGFWEFICKLRIRVR